MIDQKKIIFLAMPVLLGVIFILLMQDDSANDSEITSAPYSEQKDAREVLSGQNKERALPVQHTVPSDSILPYKSVYGPLPGTLEGTLMQQALVVDEQGNLRISSDLKRVFDYFLSTIEEEPLEVILNRIREYLDFSLDEPALTQAKDIMGQYVAFKTALFDFEEARAESLQDIMIQSGEVKGAHYLALLKEQLDAQRDLRSLHLGAETHEAFYADQEAYDRYSLARMEVNADKTLTEEEKRARFADIDAQAPADIVESRRASQITDILKEKTQTLKSAGASQQDIKALRTEMLGVEAAERFDVLDQERATWQGRIDSYLQRRQAILANEGLDVVAQQQQIHTLRQNEFDAREQIRLNVYERKADAVK